MLNEMVLCEELFHTPSDVAFADFITEGHRETWPIRSKGFRAWLRRCYYHATGSAPSAAAIRSALDLLEARAQFDGPERLGCPPVRFRRTPGMLPLPVPERAEDETSMTAPNNLSVRRALEAAGVEFIDENGGGPGGTFTTGSPAQSAQEVNCR
jgi:hypothetical protein